MTEYKALFFFFVHATAFHESHATEESMPLVNIYYPETTTSKSYLREERKSFFSTLIVGTWTTSLWLTDPHYTSKTRVTQDVPRDTWLGRHFLLFLASRNSATRPTC